jgi:hypothetical protein
MTAYTQAHSYRMRLTRLTIKNFRNLDGVDIPLVGGRWSLARTVSVRAI